MGLKVYVSGMSGNKEVKKRQQRVLMILDSKNIKYDTIDITEPGKETEKDFMQTKSTCSGATIGDQNPRHPLPPQLFNDEEYCGDYDAFDLANEIDTLEQFLKLAPADTTAVTSMQIELKKDITEASVASTVPEAVRSEDDKENQEVKENERVIVDNKNEIKLSADDKPEATTQGETENAEITDSKLQEQGITEDKTENEESNVTKLQDQDSTENKDENEETTESKEDITEDKSDNERINEDSGERDEDSGETINGTDSKESQNCEENVNEIDENVLASTENENSSEVQTNIEEIQSTEVGMKDTAVEVKENADNPNESKADVVELVSEITADGAGKESEELSENLEPEIIADSVNNDEVPTSENIEESVDRKLSPTFENIEDYHTDDAIPIPESESNIAQTSEFHTSEIPTDVDSIVEDELEKKDVAEPEIKNDKITEQLNENEEISITETGLRKKGDVATPTTMEKTESEKLIENEQLPADN